MLIGCNHTIIGWNRIIGWNHIRIGRNRILPVGKTCRNQPPHCLPHDATAGHPLLAVGCAKDNLPQPLSRKSNCWHIFGPPDAGVTSFSACGIAAEKIPARSVQEANQASILMPVPESTMPAAAIVEIVHAPLTQVPRPTLLHPWVTQKTRLNGLVDQWRRHPSSKGCPP